MPRLGGALDIVQVSDPATPSAGRQFLYFKSDGHLYTKLPSTGTVVQIDGGSAPANMVTTDSTQTGLTGDKTSSGIWKAGVLSVAGLTGAVSASRYVGATASVAPSTGTFAAGDFVIALTGTIWVCTVAGSPGTWIAVGARNNLVTSVASKTGAITLVAGDIGTGTSTGDWSARTVGATGLSGAATTIRLAGANSSGAPVSGTWTAGDLVASISEGRLFLRDGSSTWNEVGSIVTAQSVLGYSGSITNNPWTGGTTSGSPVGGTVRIAGQWVVARDGQIWVCTVTGDPGTWVAVGSQNNLITSVAGRTGAVIISPADIATGTFPGATYTFGDGSAGISIRLNGIPGAAKLIDFQTGALSRWKFQVLGTAESGSNAGSDLVVRRFDDSGVSLGDAIALNRATGVATFSAAPGVPDASFSALKLSATGTKDGTKFLRDDNTWTAPTATPAPLVTTYTFSAALSTYPDLLTHSGYVTTANGWPVAGFLSGFRNGAVGTQRLQAEATGSTYARFWTGSAWSVFMLYLDSQDYSTKGSLQVSTAVNTVSELVVGSDNMVLTADSTTATGLKWETPVFSSYASSTKFGTD